ncbi:MAG: hypothetical protein HKN13_11465 [Rhodothermales bacterium]|nr:hypothetical protein [Rhodothermales bacterium]
MIPNSIAVVGAPRSGTEIVARVLAQAGGAETVLTTEHRNKKHRPWEKLDVVDHQAWWETFAYPSWDSVAGRPWVEEPIDSAMSRAALRLHYQRLSGSKRLIVKNPNNTLRMPILRSVLDGVRFLGVTRDPWRIMESSLRGYLNSGKYSEHFLLKTTTMRALPRDPLLLAAETLRVTVAAFEKSDDLFIVRVEDLANPSVDLRNQLAEFTDLRSLRDAASWGLVNAPRPVGFLTLKEAIVRSSLRDEILDRVSQYATAFGYSDDWGTLPDAAEPLAGSPNRSSLLKRSTYLARNPGLALGTVQRRIRRGRK